ncbi:MAG: hypothetical protein H7Z37_14145 [Pyrinomonadaceae bacterium]|nr:hypothetical protein [Pyrinomonadaceae bacterium]
MIAIIVFIVAALFIYRQAYVSGRDPMRWIIAGLGIFFSIQILMRVLFFLVVLFFQSSPETLAVINGYGQTVDIISFILSLCGLLLVMWQVSQKPDDSPNPNSERPL